MGAIPPEQPHAAPRPLHEDEIPIGPPRVFGMSITLIDEKAMDAIIRAKRAAQARVRAKMKAKRDADPVLMAEYQKKQAKYYATQKAKYAPHPRPRKTEDEKREKRRAALVAWRQKNPDKYREIVRNSVNQGNRAKKKARDEAAGPKPTHCPICLEMFGPKRLHVYEHCHQGGHFRGWTCSACNSVLGFAKDNPETLMRAAEYLRLDRARNPLVPVLADPAVRRKV